MFQSLDEHSKTARQREQKQHSEHLKATVKLIQMFKNSRHSFGLHPHGLREGFPVDA